MSLDPDKMLSPRLKVMEESATIKMAQKARDLATRGIDVISLTLGEPDFDTPEFIKNAAFDALKKGDTKYTPVPGTLALRKTISEKFKNENQLDYSPSQIVVSNGAKQSIANICMSVLSPGDEAIVLGPYWVSYVEIVRFSGGEPIVVSAGIDDDFKPDASAIQKALSPKTKLLIFSSPCNPSGSVWTKDELQKIANVVASHPNCLVVSDEIYEYINFESHHCSIGMFENMKGRVATVNGFSKGFAMTGWRLGYMGAPQWLADACNKVQGQITSGAASFSQAAAVVALQSSRQETLAMKDAFLKRRDLMLESLKGIPGIVLNLPKGAFYIFMDISFYFGKSNGQITISDADEFAEIMLSEAHVGLVSGVAFGNEKCVRLSYATSDEALKEAARRIKKTLASFQ
ncbi:MAG: pyridoxal phosphate-dependent aminotransferase [Saprospiraceae bacterium]